MLESLVGEGGTSEKLAVLGLILGFGNKGVPEGEEGSKPE
jgi:hypothetical protein